MAEIRTGVVSITGDFRDNNEDAFVVDPHDRFFIVCDGMGGQSAGEKASALATELVPRKLEQTIDFDSGNNDDVVAKIDAAIAYANSEIMALSQLDPNYHNMGTTIAFIVAVSGKFFVGGVGDSRAYRLRGDTLQQLTKDHSLTRALIEAGTITEEDAVTHRYRNVLWRYLGTKEGSSGTEARELSIEPGDRFILCSDGVTDGLREPKLTELLKQYADPQAAAEAIVAAAVEGGSKDNITCLAVYVV
jgi:protein phosphatase